VICVFRIETTQNLRFVVHIALYFNLYYIPVTLYFVRLFSRFFWMFCLMFLGLKCYAATLGISVTECLLFGGIDIYIYIYIYIYTHTHTHTHIFVLAYTEIYIFICI